MNLEKSKASQDTDIPAKVIKNSNSDILAEL